MATGLANFCAVLGHRFSDEGLLRQALTHRSSGAKHNERLEFLGDAVLDLVISEYLYARFRTANEGDLSRSRAQLVRQNTLASIARKLTLTQYLRLGRGETKTGGADRDSMLADTLEAIIGAIYLDAGLPDTRACVMRWFADSLTEIQAEKKEYKDPKTRLQEFVQARGQDLPQYEIVDVSGEPHKQSFTIRCSVPGLRRTVQGTASSRRKAEQLAAAQALQLLGERNDQ